MLFIKPSVCFQMMLRVGLIRLISSIDLWFVLGFIMNLIRKIGYYLSVIIRISWALFSLNFLIPKMLSPMSSPPRLLTTIMTNIIRPMLPTSTISSKVPSGRRPHSLILSWSAQTRRSTTMLLSTGTIPSTGIASHQTPLNLQLKLKSWLKKNGEVLINFWMISLPMPPLTLVQDGPGS